MNFINFKFVYISLDYLKALYEADSEIFFVNSSKYEKKPYLGILINEANRKYVIPLTSAKPKHAAWNDVTATMYRIYEIINIQTTKISDTDIIVDINNINILRKKNIKEFEYSNFKKRILSILEIKKMFPVKEGVYHLAELTFHDNLDSAEKMRRELMRKEYEFCVSIKSDIMKKANKIYKKQIESGKILKYHCNYKKLEQVCEQYQVNS